MADRQSIIAKLSILKEKDKFSDQKWQDRGLNPSSSLLNSIFTDMLHQLIDALHDGKSQRSLRSILSNTLSKFNTRDYDTEEREFIGDTFSEISKVLNIDFKRNLNRWMYGPLFGTLINISLFLKGADRVLETITQECVKCKRTLETYIMRREDGIPEYSFEVIRCNDCNEYNLLDVGPNVKEYKYGHYRSVEQLSKEEYTKEQAEIRVEQIRLYRRD